MQRQVQHKPFSARVKALHHRYGLKPLAKALGVSHRTLEGYEQGRPTTPVMVRLVQLIEQGVLPVDQ